MIENFVKVKIRIMKNKFQKQLSLLTAICLSCTFLAGNTVGGLTVSRDEIDAKERLNTYLSDKATSETDERVRIIVKYDDEFSGTLSGDSAIASENSFASAMRTADMEILDTDSKTGLIVGTVPASEVNTVIASLNSEDGVLYAQPDYKLTAAESVCNPKQWAIQNNGQTVDKSTGESGFDMDLPEAWKITEGSEEITVAVIDTGIDIAHPDLLHSIWINPNENDNGLDDDANRYTDDINGWDFVNNDNSVFDLAEADEHGTHIAGILAANGTVKGVAPNIKIMPLKALEHSGGYTSDIIEAIEYAKNHGVRIINCSFAGTRYNPALYDAIASNPDILFVCAAGNYGCSTDELVTYPACYNLDNILSVSAANNKGKLSQISTFGDGIDVSAPGIGIYSTLPGGKYGYMDGTSCSAAYVSGVAALLLSADPTLTCQNLKEKIENSCTDKISAENTDSASEGEGFVKAAEALQYEPEEKDDPFLFIADSEPYNPYELYPFAFRLQNGTIEFTLDPNKSFSSAQLKVFRSTSDKEHGYLFSGSVSSETAVLLEEIPSNEAMTFVVSTTDSEEKSEYYGTLTKTATDSLSYLDVDVLASNSSPVQIEVQASSEDFSEQNTAGTLASKEKYESEGNDTPATADRTYDDYNNYGYISKADDIDYFKIKFSEAGYANFWLGTIPDGCDYDLYIYDSENTLLVSSKNAGNEPELIRYLAVQADVYYYVCIKSYRGYSASSPYTMRVKLYDQSAVDDDNDTFSMAYTLTGYSNSVDETMSDADDVDFFKIVLPQNENKFVAKVTVKYGNALRFQVYNSPDEDPVFTGGSKSTSHQFDADNDFYVKVYSVGNIYPDSYVFSVELYPLRDFDWKNAPIDDELPENFDRAFYEIATTKNTGMQIDLFDFNYSGGNDFDLHLYSEDYSEELDYSNKEFSEIETVHVCLPGGSYRLMVRRAKGNGQAYTLAAEYSTVSNAGKITVSGVRSVMTSGQTIRIKITATNLGAREWTPQSNYKLGALSDCSDFGIDSVKFGNIAFNESETITLNLTAPETEQEISYSLEWQLMYGSIKFGEAVTQTVTVKPDYEKLSESAMKTIKGADSRERYEINISRRGLYAFRTFRYSTDIDTKLTLYNSSLSTVASNDDVKEADGNRYSRIEALLTPGTYYLDVEEYYGKPIYCTVMYEPIEYAALSFGKSVSVANEYEGYYKFTVKTAGTYVIATSKQGTSCDTYLQLFDGETANGTESSLLAANDNSANAYAVIETDLSPGTYYVRAATYDYLINAYDKKVNCKLAVTSTADDVTDDTTPQIEITYPSNGDVIRAYNGDKIKISGIMSNVGTVTVTVNGTSLSGVKTYGGRFECYYTPTENKTCTIAATGKSLYGSQRVTSRISATILVNDDGNSFETATSISLGTDRIAAIDYEKDVDCFVVSPRKDGWYSISTQGETDTIISIYNSGYSLLGYNDDNRLEKSDVNADVPLYLSKHRLYYVVVHGAFEDEVGEYLLCTRSLQDDNYDIRTLTESISLNASIDYPGDEDTFCFTPTVSGTYSIETFGSTDTICLVYDYEGIFMDYDDDSGNDSNSKITVELSAGQEYYFVVQAKNIYEYDAEYKIAVERS